MTNFTNCDDAQQSIGALAAVVDDLRCRLHSYGRFDDVPEGLYNTYIDAMNASDTARYTAFIGGEDDHGC